MAEARVRVKARGEARTILGQLTAEDLGDAIDDITYEAIRTIDPKTQAEISSVLGAIVLKAVRVEGGSMATELAKNYARDTVAKAIEELKPKIEAHLREAIAAAWENEIEKATRDCLERAIQEVKRKVMGGV